MTEREELTRYFQIAAEKATEADRTLAYPEADDGLVLVDWETAVQACAVMAVMVEAAGMPDRLAKTVIAAVLASAAATTGKAVKMGEVYRRAYLMVAGDGDGN